MPDPNSTVPDDDIGSLEDRFTSPAADPRCAPTAPTIHFPTFENAGVSAPDGSENAACCTKLLHQTRLNQAKSPSPSTDFATSDCCTSLLHQTHKCRVSTTMRKPSQRSPSSSSRSPTSSGQSSRRSSGMIVRGRVFYLRIKVPSRLQHQIGPH